MVGREFRGWVVDCLNIVAEKGVIEMQLDIMLFLVHFTLNFVEVGYIGNFLINENSCYQPASVRPKLAIYLLWILCSPFQNLESLLFFSQL